MPLTSGSSDPPGIVIGRWLFVGVMVVGIVLPVVAAAALVSGHDPDAVVLSSSGYRRGGYHILFPELVVCAACFVVNALALVAFLRTRPRNVAAAYAFANGIFVPFFAASAAGQWLSAADLSGATATAVGAGAAWLAVASTVAAVYWARQRRYDAGGSPSRSALAAIAEALNMEMER